MFLMRTQLNVLFDPQGDSLCICYKLLELVSYKIWHFACASREFCRVREQYVLEAGNTHLNILISLS